MRLKYLTIFLAVLAAASLPRSAQAQDCDGFGCDSYGVYDPYSNEISGYSRTVDYQGYHPWLWAVSNLVDQGQSVAASSYVDIGEAEADVYWSPDQDGDFQIEGSHFYECGGWNWLGDSYYNVSVTLRSPDPTPNITGVAPSPWPAGQGVSFTVNGTGFGTNPTVTITDANNNQVYSGSCWGTQCDTSISGSAEINTIGNATVTVTSTGYSGMGFLGNSGQPTSNGWPVEVDAQQTSYTDPAGEVSDFVEWLWNYHPTRMSGSALFDGSRFSMTLLGHGPNGTMAPGEGYGGISVFEKLTGFQDGCYNAMPSSAFGELHVSDQTGSTWPVQTVGQGSNAYYVYQYDFIGAKAGWVGYYLDFILQMSGENGASCSTSILQEMKVALSPNGPYASGYSGVTVSTTGDYFAYRGLNNRPN